MRYKLTHKHASGRLTIKEAWKSGEQSKNCECTDDGVLHSPCVESPLTITVLCIQFSYNHQIHFKGRATFGTAYRRSHKAGSSGLIQYQELQLQMNTVGAL